MQTRKIGQNYILRRFLARNFAALEILARVSTICAIIFHFWQKSRVFLNFLTIRYCKRAILLSKSFRVNVQIHKTGKFDTVISLISDMLCFTKTWQK